MELAEIVMNPARQRIFQFFLLHETGTVKELKKALPDIPSASLYRHIKILADCSILMVVDENRIRGTVESVYQLNKDAMATEDETGNVVQMSLLSICASFAKYFSTGNADPQKDMMLFTIGKSLERCCLQLHTSGNGLPYHMYALCWIFGGSNLPGASV